MRFSLESAISVATWGRTHTTSRDHGEGGRASASAHEVTLAAQVKGCLYSDVERSERSVAQNARRSLAGNQKLDICDQSVSVRAAPRPSTLRLSINVP